MFKFIREDDFVSGELPVKVEYTFDSDVTWPEVLDGFVHFLKGCGYVLPLDFYATVFDNATSKDTRSHVEDMWEKYAEGEENANTSS